MASAITLSTQAAKTSNILNPDGTSIDQSFAPTNGGMFRNRIINGDMRIDQRNAGASVGGTLGYITDRWACLVSQANKITGQQNAGSVTPPVGFTNYLGFTSTSNYASLSGDYFFLTQKIEGFNVSDLAWGTANASAVTLSFRVYSSLTGTFSGALTNSAENRSYPFTYSVSSANTWTTITVTIPGDTAGTWLTTNGTGIAAKFNLGSGSTRLGTAGAWAGSTLEGVTGSLSVVGTNGATLYITGVQLEKGSSATPFEVRPIGVETQLCYRYFASTGRQDMVTVGGRLLLQGHGVLMRSTPIVSVSETRLLGAGTLQPAPTWVIHSLNGRGYSNEITYTSTDQYSLYGITFSAEL